MTTHLLEFAERLSRLFGPEFEIIAEWDGLWYEITAWKDGRRADWTMLPGDLLLSDPDIITRFIMPVKSVWQPKGQENIVPDR
jgi:hypothetical protein